MNWVRSIQVLHICFLLGYLATGLWTGCAQVNFEESQKDACKGFGQACIVEPNGSTNYDYTETVSKPKVDILFVDDNSKSMAPEQQKMSERFSTFIQSLAGVDWQIAITTTDIALNGAFLNFSSGQKV